MALTVFSAEKPEQLLQLFLIYTQREGRVACSVVIPVRAGKGCEEVPVLLGLGCGGKEQKDAMAAHCSACSIEMASPLAPRMPNTPLQAGRTQLRGHKPYLTHQQVESVSGSCCRSRYGGAPRSGRTPGHPLCLSPFPSSVCAYRWSPGAWHLPAFPSHTLLSATSCHWALRPLTSLRATPFLLATR